MALRYNAAGLPTGFKYGNGIYASFGFSPDRLLLQSLAYTKSSTTLFSTNYWYKTDATNCPSGAAGNNGRIQCITDNVDSGRTASYSYDSLYRLTNAATNGSTNYPKWGLSMAYDRYGNRSAQSISSGCTGLTCPTNSVTVSASTNQITGSPYGYDANGNMTNDGQNTLVYDVENRALSATNGSNAGAYVYDGNNLRVEKCVPSCTSPTTSTVYIFSGSKVIAEYDNGAAVASPSREYIYSGALLLAKIDSSGTKYYHQDHLSNRYVTDSSGNKIAELGHFPFGESWYNASGDKLLFTSYERDSESTNDYAIARSYVNRIARFSARDPLSGSTDDPQSLNHYSYGLNDPVNLVDPAGLTPLAYNADINPDAWNEWLFEMFLEGSDSNSDLSITSGETRNGEEWVEQDDPGAIFNLQLPDLGLMPLGPLGSPPPPCSFNILVNNRAGLGAGRLGNAEDQIKSLFGAYVGVNFVSSGSSDYTLNVANASAGDSDLGHQTGFWFVQFTPVVHPNNIDNFVSAAGYSGAYNQVLGTVGAHELLHRMGIGDLPYTASSPADLMSLDKNPNGANLLLHNGLSLTASEALRLQGKCLQKHPE